MSDLTHLEQIELRLKNELDKAEGQLRDAAPHEMADTRLRYRRAIQRFARLVVDGILPED